MAQNLSEQSKQQIRALTKINCYAFCDNATKVMVSIKHRRKHGLRPNQTRVILYLKLKINNLCVKLQSFYILKLSNWEFQFSLTNLGVNLHIETDNMTDLGVNLHCETDNDQIYSCFTFWNWSWPNLQLFYILKLTLDQICSCFTFWSWQ